MSYARDTCLNNIGKHFKNTNLIRLCTSPCKVFFTPSQKIKYLGFELDSVSIIISLLDIKKRVLVELCDSILAKYRATIQEIAEF